MVTSGPTPMKIVMVPSILRRIDLNTLRGSSGAAVKLKATIRTITMATIPTMTISTRIRQRGKATVAS